MFHLKKLLVFVAGFLVSWTINASNIVDLYGADSKISKEILKKYGREIGEIESVIFKELVASGKDPKNFEDIIIKRMGLVEKIKQENDFFYVDFELVFYPNNKNRYITIEVINKNQPARMHFINGNKDSQQKSSKQDLINKMIEFKKIDMQLLMESKLGSNKINCPVYHCLTGFEHEKLKPYLDVFNRGAIEEKQLIIDTLNKDEDPARKSAAAFLMGHFSDPKEIISLLTPHVNDSDSRVRNDVMRVLAQTMEKSKISQVDAMPFLNLLDSPYDTDRNKALYVLSTAVESEAAKTLVIQHGKTRLLALLELKQPNNHDLAYLILKKISGKKFADTNVKAWDKWFSSAQSKIS